MNVSHSNQRALIKLSFTLFLASLIIVIALAGLHCTSQGPAGPPGYESRNDPAIPPFVVSSMPWSGSVGPFTQIGDPNAGYHFILQFNKIMDLRSFTTSKFHVTGFQKPVFVTVYYDYCYRLGKPRPSISGTNSSYLDDVVAFTIRDSSLSTLWMMSHYSIGQSYGITADTGLVDINGNHTTRPFSFYYTPEPYFRLVQSTPASGDADFPQLASVILRFNSKATPAIFQGIHISPSTPGIWRFDPYDYDSMAVRFDHIDPFPRNVPITISLDSTVADYSGNRLKEGVTIHAAVASFNVSNTFPVEGRENVGLGQYVYISFNSPIDSATARNAITISPPIAHTVYATGPETPGYIEIHHSASFVPSTTYTVRIGTSLRATDGARLAVPFSFQFKTEPFYVSSTVPENLSTGNSRSAPVKITCNVPVDLNTAPGSFSVSPQVAGTFSQPDSMGFVFTPSARLPGNTTVTVTLSSALRTKGGIALPTPYSFIFKTAP